MNNWVEDDYWYIKPESITVSDEKEIESLVLDQNGEPYVKKKTYNPGFKPNGKRP